MEQGASMHQVAEKGCSRKLSTCEEKERVGAVGPLPFAGLALSLALLDDVARLGLRHGFQRCVLTLARQVHRLLRAKYLAGADAVGICKRRSLCEAHTAHNLKPRQFQLLGLLHDHDAMGRGELGQSM